MAFQTLSYVRYIIGKEPFLLRRDPINTIRPKLDFLLSKGASCSEVVDIVTPSPRYLKRSLVNHIIPSYNFVKRFLHHDKRTITAITRCSGIIFYDDMVLNVKLLLDNGVPVSSIARFLHTWPRLFNLTKDESAEAKELGHDPLKSTFIPALYATKALSKWPWERKVDVHKSFNEECWDYSTLLYS
ncbi:hypothetical protein L6164_031800 [Bauhinia variegata]|uniref:Uncharacterized protein n=1 Tax=Bauhinia variegata TaxID=167791 RepID=A0ACB9KLR8_BAUVA|nr:hypothetical protein L6164_031800 [Bauhinia variegata]